MALAPVLAAVLAAPALGQETQAVESAAGREGVISFTPADFAAARPNTALEMINRLPGFTLLTGETDLRGFAGAASNVLIDGQRPTIKTETISDMLTRIPISQVDRIELIRGGTVGIDMQGQAVVANVIRKRVDTFQQVVTATGIWFADTGKALPGWTYQATRQAGEHQFDFQLGRSISYDDSVGFGTRKRTSANGTVFLQDAESEAEGFVLSARANYKGPLFGGLFSANGLISTDEFKNENHFVNNVRREYFSNRSANDRVELGLNYTRDLTSQLEIEALTLGKFAVGSGDALGLVVNRPSSVSEVQAEAGETIGRTVLRYAHSPVLSFEGGGEVAFNWREQTVGLTENGVPVPLPASDVRIEELRGELFAQGTWRVSPKLSIEGGVRVERSKLTQSGDISLEREFTYPKPRLLATWSLTDDDQLRVRVERVLSQLNFRDFASNVNLTNGVLSAGNPDLEPSKTWVYEAAYEKRFWENGAAVLTLRHEEITDVVDQFPFAVFVDADRNGVPDDADGDGQPDQRRVAGPGNIGDGTNDVIDFNLTLPLQPLGVEGGEFRITSSFKNGEVRDPLTGDLRRISSQRPDDVRVSFRQDLPEQKLTYGLSYYAGWEEQRFLLQEVQTLEIRDFWSAFLEYKPTPSFTLRGEVNNFAPYEFSIERQVYTGPRDTGALDFVETERRQSQLMVLLRGRWTLG